MTRKPLLDPQHALALVSGGQDSAIALAWALDRFAAVETVGFDYGQRHAVELVQRQRILAGLRALSAPWDARLGPDHLIDLRGYGAIARSALTADQEIAFAETGLPTTFVPARNLVFLSAAAAIAYRRSLGRLVLGACETDYSGYPDCRQATLDAMAQALSLGLDASLAIDAPLMAATKAESWGMAERLGGKALVALILEESHSCYRGERGARHAWGHGCGTCPACELRAKGWSAYAAGRQR